MTSKIERNIPILFTIQALRWFLMIMPIIVLFFQDNGLSIFQVMVVQGVFSFTMLAFEIPSGYFSDRIGRKISMILGLSISTIGLFIFGLAPGFAGFIIAEALLGIGESFISGTDTSLLYDTLLVTKNEDSHHKREGLYISIGNYSESLASILGGFIAIYSMKLNFFIEGGLLILAIILSLFLIEPEIERIGTKSINFKDFFRSIVDIMSNPKRSYLVIFGALTGLGTYLVLWYIQPEMAKRGLPISYFGLLWAGLNFLVGIFSSLSHKIPIKGHPINSLAVVPLLLSLLYFVLPFLSSYWILGGFILFYILRGLKVPLERNLIHREIDSQNRATLLSIQSMLMRTSFTILGPVFALFSTDRSNSYVYIAIGCFFMVLTILNFTVKRRVI